MRKKEQVSINQCCDHKEKLSQYTGRRKTAVSQTKGIQTWNQKIKSIHFGEHNTMSGGIKCSRAVLGFSHVAHCNGVENTRARTHANTHISLFSLKEETHSKSPCARPQWQGPQACTLRTKDNVSHNRQLVCCVVTSQLCKKCTFDKTHKN